jgi:hypothetical protein
VEDPLKFLGQVIINGVELNQFPETKKIHPWVHPIKVSYVPGNNETDIKLFVRTLLDTFEDQGHTVLDHPQQGPDLLLTSAEFGKVLDWRQAYLFTSRRRFGLSYNPMVVTLVWVKPHQFKELIDHFNHLSSRETALPGDYPYPGLAQNAYRTLHEQNLRGGALLAVSRLLQVWVKSIRVVLVVGEEKPLEAYLFDLVGMHPRIPFQDASSAYQDLANRLTTIVCTRELTNHQVVGERISQAIWKLLDTPQAMRSAGLQFGRRGFFTEGVQINHLADVPVVGGVIARQYSEGCFATWDARINGLISTITGSARQVDKDDLSDDELAVVVGIRPDGLGALVQEVEGKRNDPPSSEAVEMLLVDQNLPRVNLVSEVWGFDKNSPALSVPVIRSKLHGHRGVRSYDPQYVEHVPLDTAFYDYPVSCSTEAQAMAIQRAFERSQALKFPDDPRLVVFTVLPGHGAMIVEKWSAGKQPFQVVWEFMDAGRLVIDSAVPQGRLEYVKAGELMVLRDLENQSLQG